MDYKTAEYLNIGKASELKGGDRILYRFLEILPGALSWGTLIILFLLAAFKPVWAAVFIIAFDLYWLLKTTYLITHHLYNWKRMKKHIDIDWRERLKGIKHDHVYHLILLPFYKEGREVVESGIRSLLAVDYRKDKLMIVLATEERAGEEAFSLAKDVEKKFGKNFGGFLVTKHPANVSGEMAGKGSNISYAIEEARKSLLDQKNLKYEDVIVSALDIDTVVYPKYFSCLTWYYLNTEDRLNASFQPVPLYNNNIWHAPAISRVAALSGTYWQMIQQERPEALVTFSSHSVSFKSLYDINYWQRNMVSEDSRIFWNLYMANNGNYRVVPITYPVSMDANLADTFWQTTKNIYKQHLRWMWGVENVPYILFGFIKNKSIPLGKKIFMSFVQMEGFWSLATNPIIILILGWLPVMIGGAAFNSTVLSHNLPYITRDLMTITMIGLFFSAIIGISILPPMPENLKNKKFLWIIMFFQWILVPIIIIVFAAIPGLHAQTRLMFGRYMGYWNTPKHRVS